MQYLYVYNKDYTRYDLFRVSELSQSGASQRKSLHAVWGKLFPISRR